MNIHIDKNLYICKCIAKFCLYKVQYSSKLILGTHHTNYLICTYRYSAKQ